MRGVLFLICEVCTVAANRELRYIDRPARAGHSTLPPLAKAFARDQPSDHDRYEHRDHRRPISDAAPIIGQAVTQNSLDKIFVLHRVRDNREAIRPHRQHALPRPSPDDNHLFFLARGHARPEISAL